MRVLITDTGKYVPGGQNYYFAFTIYKILKDNKYDVEIYKDTYYDKPYDATVLSEKEVMHKKYALIISLFPMDFEFIRKYIKVSKASPSIIFLDKAEYINLFKEKNGIFDFKQKSLEKGLIKILNYIDTYVSFSNENFINTNYHFRGIKFEYVPPKIDEIYFAKSINEIKDDVSFPIIFANKVSFKHYDLDTLVNAVDYIVNKTDFLENYNFLIDFSATGEDEKKFNNLIYKKGLSEFFNFAEVPRNEFPDFLKRHRFVIILPKKHITVSDIITWMASGLPALISDNFNEVIPPNDLSLKRGKIEDLRDKIVNDTHNGLVYEHGNYKDLAEKMMLMISSNLTNMKKFAYLTARNFDPKSFDLKLLSIIKNVIEEKENNEIKEYADSDI